MKTDPPKSYKVWQKHMHTKSCAHARAHTHNHMHTMSVKSTCAPALSLTHTHGWEGHGCGGGGGGGGGGRMGVKTNLKARAVTERESDRDRQTDRQICAAKKLLLNLLVKILFEEVSFKLVLREGLWQRVKGREFQIWTAEKQRDHHAVFFCRRGCRRFYYPKKSAET